MSFSLHKIDLIKRIQGKLTSSEVQWSFRKTEK